MSIKFASWSGPDGLENYIKFRTETKPYSGEGISIRKDKNLAILKSVDGTEFYDDDLSNPKLIKYTLFGHNGDQDPDEPKYNKKLLDPEITKQIYVYRRIFNEQYKYIWYGEYKILNMETKNHPGKDGLERKIVILNLSKI